MKVIIIRITVTKRNNINIFIGHFKYIKPKCYQLVNY